MCRSQHRILHEARPPIDANHSEQCEKRERGPEPESGDMPPIVRSCRWSASSVCGNQFTPDRVPVPMRPGSQVAKVTRKRRVGPVAGVQQRKRIGVAVILTTLLVGVLVGTWATHEGYIPPLSGEACSLEGYDPIPSFEALITEYGKSPYCARVTRGETW